VVPTIVVAIFSAITLNMGIEAWFSNRVNTAVNSSVLVADDYVKGHKQSIRSDAINLNYILGSLPLEIRADRARLGDAVRNAGVILGLHAIHVLDAAGQPVLRLDQGDVNMSDPTPQDLAQVPYGEVGVLLDEKDDQVRAIMRVTWPGGGYLYIGRRIN